MWYCTVLTKCLPNDVQFFWFERCLCIWRWICSKSFSEDKHHIKIQCCVQNVNRMVPVWKWYKDAHRTEFCMWTRKLMNDRWKKSFPFFFFLFFFSPLLLCVHAVVQLYNATKFSPILFTIARLTGLKLKATVFIVVWFDFNGTVFCVTPY